MNNIEKLIEYSSIYMMIGVLHQIIILVVHAFLSRSESYIGSRMTMTAFIKMIVLSMFVWPVIIIIRIIQLERLEQTLLHIEKDLDQYMAEEKTDDEKES